MRRAAFLAALLLAAPARATEDEVIDDPLLHPTPTSTSTSTSTPTATPTPTSTSTSTPQLWRLSVFSRGSTQTSWDDLPGGPKDIVEWRSRALLSAGDKPSAWLKWEIGVRFDALARAQRRGDPAITFEARPWEAYLDVAPAERLRLKVGNQILSWGRLDVGSAADVLGAYDLREGPAIDLDALRIPTPTATATWFPVDAFQLDVGYTPFFTPHRFDVAGTNYAIIGPNAPAAVAAAFQKLRGQLDPSSYAAITADFARVNAPDARPDNGELGSRATWRTGPYDLALTYGFVRSKIPTLTLAPELVALLGSGNATNLTAAGQVNAKLQNGEHLLSASYDRYHQIALDLEGTAGPFTVAGEVGVSPQRTLFVRDADTGLPSAVRTPVAQAGLKATYAKEETFAISAEASVLTATQGSGATYFVLGPHRRIGIAFVAVHDELGHHVLDAAALATTSGPSFSLIPRYGYKLTDALVVGAGAALFAGPRGDDGSLATAQRGTDQVFVYVDLRL